MSLDLQTIRERRDYFASVLMCKHIHGLAPHCLSNYGCRNPWL